MTKRYVYEGTKAGRPPMEIAREPPDWFCRHDILMQSLDARGWYREIARRLRGAGVKAHYDPDELSKVAAAGFYPVLDPVEMDRLMCRTEPVAVVADELDLKIAQRNNHLVVEIDVNTHDDELNRLLKLAIAAARGSKKPRRHQFEVWSEHRILALLDLQIGGCDPDKDRKQMARWLFPEVVDDEQRGQKFDRARKYLADAGEGLNSLRHYPR